jgi:protein-arginine kinase activator protein McsA
LLCGACHRKAHNGDRKGIRKGDRERVAICEVVSREHCSSRWEPSIQWEGIQLKCGHCSHVWLPRKDIVYRCPKCKRKLVLAPENAEGEATNGR